MRILRKMRVFFLFVFLDLSFLQRLEQKFLHFILWAPFFTISVRGVGQLPLAFLGRLFHGFQYFLGYASLFTLGIHIVWKTKKKAL